MRYHAQKTKQPRELPFDPICGKDMVEIFEDLRRPFVVQATEIGSKEDLS